MLEWSLQIKAYVPAAPNVKAPVAPGASVTVVQAGSSLSVAVCPTLSLFVQAMTSPTFAEMVVGTKAMPDIPAWTVPAAVETVQSPDPDPAPADASGAEAAGAGELTPAVPAVEPVPQAASDRTAAIATVSKGNGRLDMASSKVRDEPFGASFYVYVVTTRPVSIGLST